MISLHLKYNFMKFKDKRVLITGGARRIGRAFAKAFITEGAEVIIHYRKSEYEAKEISPHVVYADLSNPNDVSTILKKSGPVDILINNASLFTKDRLKDAFHERASRELQVNLLAPLDLIRQFAQQTKSGLILNILDRRIKAHDTSCVPYSLSKIALAELTRLAALELAPNFRVNGVAPGPILPTSGTSEVQFKENKGTIPMGQTPDVKELIDAGFYLLQSRSVTGQIIYVDGGQHILGNGV